MSICPNEVLICPDAHYLPQIFIFSKSQITPSPHLFQCPFAMGVLLPYACVPNCPSVHLLKIFHIPTNAHLPRCPILPYCPSFPQIPICYSAHFPPNVELPEFSAIYFGPRIPLCLLPIWPKCSFTPNFPYPPYAHLPKSPFATVPIPKCLLA